MDHLIWRGDRVPQISRRLDARKNAQLGSSMGPNKTSLVEIPTPTARQIYQIKAIFPFDLTPDFLIIDELKISVIYRQFFTRQVNTLLIKDITDVIVHSSIFMAALSFSGGEYGKSKPALSIPKLHIDEAQKARRIIMGMMIFSDQKVDTSQMTIAQVVEKAEGLGHAQS